MVGGDRGHCVRAAGEVEGSLGGGAAQQLSAPPSPVPWARLPLARCQHQPGLAGGRPCPGWWAAGASCWASTSSSFLGSRARPWGVRQAAPSQHPPPQSPLLLLHGVHLHGLWVPMVAAVLCRRAARLSQMVVSTFILVHSAAFLSNHSHCDWLTVARTESSTQYSPRSGRLQRGLPLLAAAGCVLVLI